MKLEIISNYKPLDERVHQHHVFDHIISSRFQEDTESFELSFHTQDDSFKFTFLKEKTSQLFVQIDEIIMVDYKPGINFRTKPPFPKNIPADLRNHNPL